MCSKNVHADVKRETVHLPHREQSDSALCPLSWKVLGLKPRLFLYASSPPNLLQTKDTQLQADWSVCSSGESVSSTWQPGYQIHGDGSSVAVMIPPTEGEATYHTFCEIEVVLFTDREERKDYIYGLLDKHLMVRKLLYGFGSRRKDRDIRGWSEMSADIIHLMHKQPPLASV